MASTSCMEMVATKTTVSSLFHIVEKVTLKFEVTRCVQHKVDHRIIMLLYSSTELQQVAASIH